MKNRPTIHLLIQLFILVSAGVAYWAIMTAAQLRGYAPSRLVAARDVLAMAMLVVGFVAIIKGLRYRGNLILYTCVVILFSLGQIAQYRLFSDPEYTSRGDQKSAARLAKAHAIRSRAIAEGYNPDKLTYVFGDATTAVQMAQVNREVPIQASVSEVLVSGRTWTPILCMIGLMVALWFVRRENILLNVQRQSILIAMVTLLPLMVIIIFFTRNGKFIGGMTPWEPAKILFLLSLSGILVDSYRMLGKTRWGLPPMRFFLPLMMTAACGLIPFFVLGDFGQLWVFSIVYAVLYLVAVKRPGQFIPGLLMLIAAFMLISSVGGIPDRVKYRYNLWKQTWEPPPETADWWAPYVKELRAAYGPAGASLTNEEAWYDKGSQLIQAVFGISHGQVVGTGLGLGLPETVPVSDSDFIYSTVAEELGLIGGLSLLLVFFLLGAAGWREAMQATDMFTKLLATGVTAFLISQALVNMAGVLKLAPMTGITLPFVSHGGWSMLTSFTMVGILMGISHRNALQLAGQGQS